MIACNPRPGLIWFEESQPYFQTNRGGDLSILLRDIRYVGRLMRKQPGVTAIVIVSLALGIGANTMIFTLVNAYMIRPLPYPESDRIVFVWFTPPNNPRAQSGATPRNCKVLRERATVFQSVGCFWNYTANVGGEQTGEAAPERTFGQWITVDLPRVIGVNPLLGRWFTPDEEGSDQAKVAVIGYNTWQKRYGGSPAVLGKPIRIDNDPYTVIGVMPKGFSYFLGNTEHWTPFPDSPIRANSPSRFLVVTGRLKDGHTIQQAQSEMNSIAAQLAEEVPSTNKEWGIRVEELAHWMTRPEMRQALLTFQGAVAFVLLIACANVAGLLLAQGVAQQKELALRSAMGSSRWRIIRQMITQSTLLALAGGAAGFAIGWAGLRIYLSTIPENFSLAIPVDLDMNVVAFTLLLSVASGVLFGLLPALQISRPDLMDALKENSRSATATRTRQRLRSAFVVLQVSLAMVLLIGAGLMIRSFMTASNVPAGINTNNLLTFQIQYPRNEYLPETGNITPFGASEVLVTPKITLTSERIRQRLAAIPGVRSATVTGMAPLSGYAPAPNFTVDGQPAPARREDLLSAQQFRILPDYFDTLELPLMRGRKIDARDSANTVPVVMINQTMAQRLWPGEDPIGKRIKFETPNELPREIIGIVGNVQQNLRALEPAMQTYIPYAQIPMSLPRNYGEGLQTVTFIVRSAVPTTQLVPALRKAVDEVDPSQAISFIRTLDDWVALQLQDQRTYAMLLGIFSAVAILLALVGIYGIMSHSVNQRTSEIGVRVALGASSRSVLQVVLRRGVVLIAIGIAIGLAGSLALTRVMQSVLFGVRPTDPITFVVALFGLAAAGILACYIPARRALKIDPIIALRYE
jgi:putative ABC transport system permease protein